MSFDSVGTPPGQPQRSLATNNKEIDVGIGEIKISRNPAAALTAYGVGSCITVCVYDPLARVAGMAHVLLPKSDGNEREKNSKIYADVAVPELMRKMKEKGAVKRRMKAKLAGGSRVVKSLSHPGGDIGKRNADEVKRILNEINTEIEFMDIGGEHGRTIRFFVGTGEMVVTSTRHPKKISG
ncbi:MAG: chemotaxis protein CheD [bacterium]